MDSRPRFPVVLLAFNRPDFTAQVLDRIRLWAPRELFFIVDGPRPTHPADKELVSSVHQLRKTIDWECTVETDFATENLGLKKRISSGLTAVFQQHEAAIVLEDDCVPDLSFFAYCDELLDRYFDDVRVGLIGGTSRLRGRRASDHSYDFSDDIRIWGWATWRRTWGGFIESGDLDGSWSPAEHDAFLARFPSGPRRNAMRKMLARAHHLDSWALPFAVHCSSRNYLSTVPEVNLVENVGFGSRSTHTTFEDFVSQVRSQEISFPLRHPDRVIHNPVVDSLESALDWREWLLYPLRHPLDTAGRIFRYFRQRLIS